MKESPDPVTKDPPMDFTTLSPTGPNLVSVIMEDRMREAEATRMAANIPASEMKTPHRFRRFLTGAVHRPKQTHQVAAIEPRR